MFKLLKLICEGIVVEVYMFFEELVQLKDCWLLRVNQLLEVSHVFKTFINPHSITIPYKGCKVFE